MQQATATEPGAASGASPRASKLPEWLDVVAASLPFVFLCVERVDFRPLWDAEQYWQCVLDGAHTTANPLAFNCFGHPTMAYLWPIGLLQKLGFGHYALVIAFNVLFGILGLFAFAGLARLVLPGPARRLERAFLLTAFAVCPVVVASAIELTPDFGVLVFTLLAIRALAEERLVAAIAWGACASMSKESGVAVYSFAACAHVIAFGLRAPGELRDKLLRAARRAWVFVVPVGYVLVNQLRKRFAAGGGGEWVGAGSDVPLWRQALTVSMLDDLLFVALTMIFVLNAMWLPSLFVFAAALRSGGRAALRWATGTQRSSRDATPFEPAWFVVAFTLVATVLLLTRFRTFANVRYFLPVFPLLLLAFGRSLAELRVPMRGRAPLVAACAAIFFVSNTRTIDPVSRTIFGVFPFGDRSMLNVTSVTHECCGRGRDQLVYNLEFAELHYLADEAIPKLFGDRSRGAHALAMHADANWFFVTWLDARTLQRAAKGPGALSPGVWSAGLLAGAPREAWPPALYYLELPNMFDVSELARWGRNYDVGPRIEFRRGAYAIYARELTLKR